MPIALRCFQSLSLLHFEWSCSRLAVAASECRCIAARKMLLNQCSFVWNARAVCPRHFYRQLQRITKVKTLFSAIDGRIVTWIDDFGISSFVKHNDSRPERGGRSGQSERLQSTSKMFVERLRCGAQKCEHVAVQTLRSCAKYCYVRNGQYFEQQTHALILVGRGAQ